MVLRRRREATSRVRRLADGVPIPEPFDVPALCEALAEERGRPIRLMPIPGMTDPCGVWIATDSTDYIAFDSATSPLHGDHIILHELGHLLCEHDSAELSPLESIAGLVQTIDPALVRRVAGRTVYATAEEREAEVLAGLIRQRADRARRRHQVDERSAASTTDCRIGPALGFVPNAGRS